MGGVPTFRGNSLITCGPIKYLDRWRENDLSLEITSQKLFKPPGMFRALVRPLPRLSSPILRRAMATGVTPDFVRVNFLLPDVSELTQDIP